MMPNVRRLNALLAVVVAATTIAHIHGKIVAINEKRGTFIIHHDPFPMMPMAMTMAVEPKNRADLRKLHVGEIVDATVDTAVVPWPGTEIRPSPARR
jgi:Cu/Ag efflux protein CusF